MKLGVFGDSYADVFSHSQQGYPCHIARLGNFTPGYHARSGTSHWWAYQQFLQHHHEYDVIIFSHTSTTRWCNLPPTEPIGHQYNIGYSSASPVLNQLNEYYHHLFPSELTSFINRHIFHDVNTTCEQKQKYLINIIPFHTDRCYHHVDTLFPVIRNLDALSHQEETYVSGEWVNTCKHLWANKILDPRECHLNTANNQQLAELIFPLIKNQNTHLDVNVMSYEWNWRNT